MKIYTKAGDVGTTTTLNHPNRLPKNHPLIIALGSLDELNSHIGLCISVIRNSQFEIRTITSHLLDIQNRLFHIGALLQASHQQKLPQNQLQPLEKSTQKLEQQIDQLSNHLPPLHQFILPGGHPTSAHIHIARAVCRRTERHVTEVKPPQAVTGYLNRLSDYLFILARHINHLTQTPEINVKSSK